MRTDNYDNASDCFANGAGAAPKNVCRNAEGPAKHAAEILQATDHGAVRQTPGGCWWKLVDPH